MTRTKNELADVSFVLTHDACSGVDGPIQALGLAVAEIIATKQVMERPYPDRAVQWDYGEKLGTFIDTTHNL